MYFLPWTLLRQMILWNGKCLKLSAKHWKMLYNRELLLKTLTVASSRFNVFIAFRPCRWTAAWGEWSILIPTPRLLSRIPNELYYRNTDARYFQIYLLQTQFSPVIRPRNHIDVSTDTEPSAARNSRFFFFFSSSSASSIYFSRAHLFWGYSSHISWSLVVDDLKLFWHLT